MLYLSNNVQIHWQQPSTVVYTDLSWTDHCSDPREVTHRFRFDTPTRKGKKSPSVENCLKQKDRSTKKPDKFSLILWGKAGTFGPTGYFMSASQTGSERTYVTSHFLFRRRLSQPAWMHHLSPTHLCSLSPESPSSTSPVRFGRGGGSLQWSWKNHLTRLLGLLQ